ncbi:DUF4178 domain-containing protein [Streptomyces bohaiensis]|uniref:DUF4178 domain-containing protein n=1 Tax=Streptomyces bohaiensis TaxID=1431344 RepID=A0ABX1CIE0_9ACTN|nr:DUF4178 domain-containing protein [Streptomyces bohaiensis]NJQ17570.1 DUF4178 domain-containing protein [Streptomyces bohaiensis]
MAYVLSFVVIGLMVALIVLLLRRQRAAEEARPALPRDPFDQSDSASGDPRKLRAGDMVEYLGERMFVRGSVRLKEGGFTWDEHFLDALNEDGSGRRWISVEEDPDLEVMLWTPYEGPQLSPSERTHTVDGITYRRTEHGVARYTSEGTTGLGGSGRVEYADYEGPGNRGLAFERYLAEDGSGTWEASLGERVPNGTLTVYPGSDA